MRESFLEKQASWRQRYQVPITYGLEIAAQAPERGVALSNRSGTYQLYAWNVPKGELTQISFKLEGVYQQATISPDGTSLYYFDDQQGNELGHLIRVSFNGDNGEDITPDFPFYGTTGYTLSRTGNCLSFIAATQEGFALYSMRITPEGVLEQPEKLFHSENLTISPTLASNGEIIATTTAEQPETLHFSLLAFDTESGKQVGRLSDVGASIEGGRFSPIVGDMRLLATSDLSGSKRPLLWNSRSGERIDLELGELEGEVQALDWSPDASHVLLCQFVQAKQHLYLYNLAQKNLRCLHHSQSSFLDGYFGPGGQIYIHLENAVTPLQLVRLDGESGTLQEVVLPVGEFSAGHPWRSVSFVSSDQQRIQAWLGVPEGSGPFPAILEMHGGPTSVKTETFDPAAQCWLDAGFAFLSLNYRGSTTFGRTFQEQIHGHLGDWELEDMETARQWLVEQHIARPDQVFLTGRSYGGYLTLLGLGRQPHLWAGGMATAAFGDFVIAYEDEAETLKAYDRGLMGGTPQERPEAYQKSSAMTYIEQVRAPLLIIQGSNDTRCPPRSIEVYEKRARELGKSIEVVWFDAGHGSHKTSELIDHQERMLRFAWQIISQRRPLWNH